MFLIPPILIIATFVWGCVLWIRMLVRSSSGGPVLGDLDDAPGFRRDPGAACLVIAVWLVVQVGVALALKGQSGALALPMLLFVMGVLSWIGMWLVLIGVETLSADDLGLVSESPARSVRAGLLGFLLAYPLVLVVLLATAAWRTRETQHSLITNLQEHPSLGVVVLTIVGAVVLAPMVEELLFRVVLQGTLRNWLQPGPAILLASLLFAFAHGWPDSLALVPLACVLGWFYERTNDYWTVVVLHATFNAFNLLNALLLDPEEIEKLQKSIEQALLC